MEKVKLTKIYRNTTNKAGEPLKTKDGKPYVRVVFKCEKYGDKYVSGFENEGNINWKIGDEVEVMIEAVGEYLNFKMPNSNVSRNEFDALVARVKSLEGDTIISEETPEDEIDVGDLGFDE